MTFLMVNLDDPVDCRRAMDQLRPIANRLRMANGGGPDRPGQTGPGRGPGGVGRAAGDLAAGELAADATACDDVAQLPLPQKLRRISQRGVFKHLRRIAAEVNQPLSLPELDRQLGLNANKMRSLKAIMAKLERRWDLQFLVSAPDGGLDESGNPRYVMPPRIRKQILRIAEVL